MNTCGDQLNWIPCFLWSELMLGQMEKALKHSINTVETRPMSSCNIFYFSVNAMTQLQDNSKVFRNILIFITFLSKKKKNSEHYCILEELPLWDQPAPLCLDKLAEFKSYQTKDSDFVFNRVLINLCVTQ